MFLQKEAQMGSVQKYPQELWSQLSPLPYWFSFIVFPPFNMECICNVTVHSVCREIKKATSIPTVRHTVTYIKNGKHCQPEKFRQPLLEQDHRGLWRISTETGRGKEGRTEKPRWEKEGFSGAFPSALHGRRAIHFHATYGDFFLCENCLLFKILFYFIYNVFNNSLSVLK